MKTWMITGTSSGFGKELALQLAQTPETKLIVTARKLNDLSYLDQYDHGNIKKLIVDVTKASAIQSAVKDAVSFSPQIDVLINNAGIGYFSTIEESDLSAVRHMFEVNFFGLATLTNALLPTFRKQRAGIIVNISSALGLTTLPTMGFYSASKYALEGYSDTLRQEVATLGIRVLTVEPSGARTNWSGPSSEKNSPQIKDYAKFKKMIDNTSKAVVDSPGDPKLIANAIINAVNSQNVPSHLPLGEFAYQGALNNIQSLEKEIIKSKKISFSTDNQ